MSSSTTHEPSDALKNKILDCKINLHNIDKIFDQTIETKNVRNRIEGEHIIASHRDTQKGGHGKASRDFQIHDGRCS